MLIVSLARTSRTGLLVAMAMLVALVGPCLCGPLASPSTTAAHDCCDRELGWKAAPRDCCAECGATVQKDASGLVRVTAPGSNLASLLPVDSAVRVASSVSPAPVAFIRAPRPPTILRV